MGEPLKDKKIILKKGQALSKHIDCNFYEENYIKSAVEWLKEQQYKELCRLQETNEGNFEKVLTLINEAFPDLNPIGSDNTRKNPEQSDYDYMI